MDGTIQSQTMDSSKLVQRFQDGEREAFDALVNLYQHRVLKLTYQFTRNPEDAADLAQEVILRAFQGLESFPGLLVRKIAQRMGKSEGTIKSHLFHALRRVRRHLESYLEV
ncbi:TPA: hypothetical protein EYP66_12200 [Candidatus Poribacteria bacterium]|nr:hypothetical protein [Candidatus Poribacteria bacterium]